MPFRFSPALALAAALLATPALAATPAAPVAIPAGSYTLVKDHAKLLWAAEHMGFSSYYGRFTAFDGSLTLDPKTPARSTLTVTIDMTSLATDNPKLDGELKGDKWLDAADFPTATFRSTSVTPTGAGHAKVAGMLTLHGITRPVTLEVKLHGAGMHPLMKVETVGFDATATFRRSDFGVATFLPMIADPVSLIISAEFQLTK